MKPLYLSDTMLVNESRLPPYYDRYVVLSKLYIHKDRAVVRSLRVILTHERKTWPWHFVS